MTDAPDPAPGSGPATPTVQEGSRLKRAVSAVWLVPIVAILIALAIAWNSYQNRGVLVAVAFPDVAGIAVGESTLRYRDVIVGVVEDVGFTPDLSLVNVYVRVDQEIAPFLDEDASFWIVQPEVSARGVSGLSTILSGVYIEGTWDADAGEARTAFLGNERAPVVPPGVQGTAFVLRARDSNRLEAGAPILYKGIEVGETSNPRLSPDGTEVRIDAFVGAPYDRQLTTATRFWDASGVTANIGGSGVELRVGSLASILEGGLNFDTLVSGGQPIEPGFVYDIYPDQDAARASAFELPTARSVAFSALFPAAAVGLASGAPVRYGGVRVGVVTDVTGYIRPDDETRTVQMLARLALQPARMGLEGVVADDLGAIDFVSDLVASGLRARLVSTSLFGGDLAVDLIQVPDLAPARLEVGITDTPLIPSVPAELSSFQDTAEGVLARLNDLPVEELLASATDLLDNLNRIAADPDTRALPGEVRDTVAQAQGLVRDGRAIVSSPDVAGVLLDVRAIAGDLREVTAAVAAQDVAEQLGAVLASASEAAADIASGARSLPDLAASAGDILASADGIVSSPDAQALPSVARSALAGVEGVVTAPELRTILSDAAGTAAAARATLEAVAAAEVAPRLVATLADVEAAAANVAAGTADLDALTEALTAAVASAEAILSDPATAALPETARAALAGVAEVAGDPAIPLLLADAARAAAAATRTLEGFADADLAARVGAVLGDVQAAAANVAAGTRDLDALAGAVTRAAASADAILSDPAAAALPAAARDALAGIAQVANDPAIPALIADGAATAAALRATAEEIAGAALAERLAATLADVEVAAANIAAGTETLPELSAATRRAVAAAERILASEDAQAIPGAARSAIEGIDAVVSDPDVDALLADLAATAAETSEIAAALNAAGAAEQLTETLADAQRAAAAVAEGTADLPLLAARANQVLEEVTVLAKGFQGVAGQVQALPLDGLVDSATTFLDSADAFISSDGADDVPPALVDTLTEIRLLVERVRTGGTLDGVDATLASAAAAAGSVDVAAQQLPDLLTRLSALSGSAGTLLTSYSDGSRFNAELAETLRSVTSAAEEIEKLARTLERNPNALIFGR